jgi:hypothetical protein
MPVMRVLNARCCARLRNPWEHHLAPLCRCPLAARGVQRSPASASRRMWANVVRVLGKQGTGALVLSSPRRVPWLRRPQLAPPPHTLSPRHFASSSSSSSAHAPPDGHKIPTFEDPSRKGLFYHLVPPPTPLSATRPVFAVSLLADAPPSSESSTVLGWLPAETPADDRDAGLNDFVQNRALSLLRFISDVRAADRPLRWGLT